MSECIEPSQKCRNAQTSSRRTGQWAAPCARLERPAPTPQEERGECGQPTTAARDTLTSASPETDGALRGSRRGSAPGTPAATKDESLDETPVVSVLPYPKSSCVRLLGVSRSTRLLGVSRSTHSGCAYTTRSLRSRFSGVYRPRATAQDLFHLTSVPLLRTPGSGIA